MNQSRKGLVWVLLCAGISISWSVSLARNGSRWVDFRALYASVRCLLHHQNPYDPANVEHEYYSEDGERPKTVPDFFQCIAVNVNLPTTYVIVAPLATLPWAPAHILWMLITGGAFVSALMLMWWTGASYAPAISTFLACIIGLNCESVFAGGNTAGVVVGLCGIAVWSFLEGRFVRMGILCLALSLAIKPHDTGLVWLYFVFAGGVYRKRALQSFAITAAIALVAALWFSHVSPHWVHDWNANRGLLTARGGINDEGPANIGIKSGTLYSIVDLQAAISIFRDDPRFYNISAYLICGTLIAVWAIWTLRTRFSVTCAWHALSVITAFTLLINYHRLWDAKLVMLAIPACCFLWAEGGLTGKLALLVTFIGTIFTGEITLVLFEMIVESLHAGGNGILARLITVILVRPATLALLGMGIFFLGTYLRYVYQMRNAATMIHDVVPVAE